MWLHNLNFKDPSRTATINQFSLLLAYPIPITLWPHPDWSHPISLSLATPSGPYFSPHSVQLPRSFITSIVCLCPQLSWPTNFNSHSSCYLLAQPWPEWNPTLHLVYLYPCSQTWLERSTKSHQLSIQDHQSPMVPWCCPKVLLRLLGSFTLPFLQTIPSSLPPLKLSTLPPWSRLSTDDPYFRFSQEKRSYQKNAHPQLQYLPTEVHLPCSWPLRLKGILILPRLPGSINFPPGL